jgi:soluble lytic murein transglycosylase-like protein
MRLKAIRPAAVRVRTGRAAAPARTRQAAVAKAGRRNDPTATSGVNRANRSIALLPTIAAALCMYDASAAAFAQEVVSCEREIARAAARYDIPLAVFYAVGLNETGWKGRLQPYSMNIDGRAVASATLADALVRFHKAKAAGARMIDIGCMQINHHYHAEKFTSLEAMFDPAQNIDYSARFLRELRQREGTWTMAVARYNAGPDNNPAQKRYVCGVMTKMVTSGFGAWTESAKKFCFGEDVAKASQ